MSAGQVVAIYELTPSGAVDAEQSVTLTAADILRAAPALTGSVVEPGTTVGTTAATTTPPAGTTLTEQITGSMPPTLATGAPLPDGVTAYASGTNLVAGAGQVLTLYAINSHGDVVAASSFPLTAADIGSTVPSR